MTIFGCETVRKPCELTFQLIAQCLGHLPKQESLGGLADGKPNGSLECTLVLVPEFLLVGIQSFEQPKARLQLLNSQWLVERTSGTGAGGLCGPAP